jgi:hypothetical protein
VKREPFEIRSPFRKEKKPGALAVSIFVHAIAVMLLAGVVFRHEIAGIIGYRSAERMVQERINYVRVTPIGGGAGGGGDTASTAQPRQQQMPTPPTSTPSAIPAPGGPPAAETPGKGSGDGTGTGGAGAADAGVRPSYGDERVWPSPGRFAPVPKTHAERVDSTIKAAFGIYEDSARRAAANAGRAPGDWTVPGKEGEKWGWDPVGIRLGKYTIPNALLALLPINNAQGNPQAMERGRADALVRRDIQFQSGRPISDDEFDKAIKRIRERKDRERDERNAAGGGNRSGGGAP